MSGFLTRADLDNADRLLRRGRSGTWATDTTADPFPFGHLAPNVAPAPETQPCSICAGQGRTSGRKCYGCKGKGYLTGRVRTP